MRSAPAEPNVWLALEPQALEHLCHDAGVDPEEGLLAELTVYGDNDSFEHDLGFGMHRVRADTV